MYVSERLEKRLMAVTLGGCMLVMLLAVANAREYDGPDYATLAAHRCVDVGRMAHNIHANVWQCDDGYRVSQ